MVLLTNDSQFGKTIKCDCENSFSFNFNSDANVEKLVILVRCPHCGKHHSITVTSCVESTESTPLSSESAGSYPPKPSIDETSSMMEMFD